MAPSSMASCRARTCCRQGGRQGLPGIPVWAPEARLSGRAQGALGADLISQALGQALHLPCLGCLVGLELAAQSGC